MYVKKIQIDNLESFSKILLSTIETKYKINYVEKSLFYLESNKILEQNTIIKKTLENLNMLNYIRSYAVVCTPKYSRSPIHIDIGPSTYTFNIPLLGCNNTYIYHFTQPNKMEKIYFNENKNSYYLIKDEDCKCVSKFETNQPYFMSVKQPHRFENPNETPRIMLLCRLNNECINAHKFTN